MIRPALAALLLVAARPAHAQDLPAPAEPAVEDPDSTAARRHFQLGLDAYGKNDFEGALKEFEAAKRVKPLPAFDFNIGRCQDRLERYREAVDSYKRYLAATPDAADAAEVKERASVLEGRLATQAPPKIVAPPVAPPVAEGPQGRVRKQLTLGLGLRVLYQVPITGATVGFSIGGSGRRGAWYLTADLLLGQTSQALFVAHPQLGVAGEWNLSSRLRLGIGETWGFLFIRRITNSEPLIDVTLGLYGSGALDLYRTSSGSSIILWLRAGIDFSLGTLLGSKPGSPILFNGGLGLGFRG